jgi:ABC-2 type transport system permease protein
VFTSLFNLGMNLIAVLIFLLAYGVSPTWTWLFFPLVVLVLFVLTAALALLLSSLYVRFRDVAIIWSVVATALFYGSPILYPFNIVPEQYRDILVLNPLTPLFAQVRRWIIDPNAPSAVETVGGWGHLVPPIAIFVVVCVLGVWVFKREAPRVAEGL